VKGELQFIKVLNEVLAVELTAINQYFLHSRMCKNWGYHRIAHFVYKESIEEMQHAQKIIDRVLFLEGIPNLQKLDKLNIGETVQEQFECDLALEQLALDRLKKALDVCFHFKDYSSYELLENILKDEEEHIDWIETQLGIIQDLGLAHYLAQQLHENS